MAKTQVTVSVPEAWLANIRKEFEPYAGLMEKMEVTSDSQFIRVLANFGKQEFMRVLSEMAKAQDNTCK